MPEFRDAYISDVVIVIDDEHYPFDQMVKTLKDKGVSVFEEKPDQHIVEGAVDTSRLHEIDDLPGVNYVRSVFTYVADFTAGHPRDKDEANREHFVDETTPSYSRGNGYRKI